jgi:antitoxin Phd
MQHTWQLQEAKNRFSELVDLSLTEGPQIVTRHGKPVVQIVPIVQTESLKLRKARSLGEHLLLLREFPGEPLQMPERRNRKPEDMVSFEEDQ